MKTCKSFKSGKSCAVLVITLLLHITFIQIRLTYDGHGYYTVQDESGAYPVGFPSWVNDGAFSKKVTVGTVNFTPLVSIITYFIVNLIKLSTVGKRGCPGLAPVRAWAPLSWLERASSYLQWPLSAKIIKLLSLNCKIRLVTENTLYRLRTLLCSTQIENSVSYHERVQVNPFTYQYPWIR